VKAKRQKNLDLITSSTLIVGVDGHSKSNTAASTLASGKDALSPKKFENSRKGFLRLLSKVDWITKKHNLDNIIFVLERAEAQAEGDARKDIPGAAINRIGYSEEECKRAA